MDKKELIQKIISKKEFSQLPRKDVEKVFEKFDKEIYSDGEKIKLTRDVLRKVFSGFTSRRLLSLKEKSVEWILKKHLSTRERFEIYLGLYEKLLKGFSGNLTVFDLGCGVNGFSYGFFPKNMGVSYIGIEAVGQLAELQNEYFKKNKISGKVFHLSLFEFGKIKNLIKKQRGKKVVFLFKAVDSLEMVERNYSKKLLLEIAPFADRIVVSFATRSFIRRKKFHANRKWFEDFARENFRIVDSFEKGDEIFFVLEKSKSKIFIFPS